MHVRRTIFGFISLASAKMVWCPRIGRIDNVELVWTRLGSRIRFVQNSGIADNLLCIAVHIKETRNRCSIFLTHHLTRYTLHWQVLEMANVNIHGGTFNSLAVQGDFHNNNKDSGMHDFRSVQESILIDDPMKDFIP